MVKYHCTSPSVSYNGIRSWYIVLEAMGRYELEVAASAALVRTALELLHAELSSSALVPPCRSLSLYYPAITLVHLPLELRSRAGAYSSNHRFLTRTSAHTPYYNAPRH
jgi:hypothetical protein